MRVISGRAKGVTLFAPKTSQIRPTTDRTKQKLFDTLSGKIDFFAQGLDLFAGSGSIGIELLSRGYAEQVIFIEKSSAGANLISKNLEKTRFSDSARIERSDVFAFLKRNHEAAFPFIFADPPYQLEYSQKLLDFISEHDVLQPGGLFILEESGRTKLQFPSKLSIITEKKSGESTLYFFRKIK